MSRIDPHYTRPQVDALVEDIDGRLSDETLAATYASKRPRRFPAWEYDSLADCFAARDADPGPAVIELAPDATYSAANLRVDEPDTKIKGNRAKITLPAGNDQDGIRVGVDAMRFRAEDFDLVGNYANQTGTSRGIYFEPYTGVDFRYADRTIVEDVNIDGFLHDAAVVDAKRLNVVFNRVFARDYGRYGYDINASDCRVLDGAAGGIRGQYGVRANQSALWVSGMGIYSNTVAGALLTEKAVGVKVVDNDLDNNLGGGIRVVGIAANSLNATITGNHFRGNSTEGDGLHSDIYLEQVSQILLANNQAYLQPGSTARTNYVVNAGAGVTDIYDYNNLFQNTYPTVGRWSSAASTARKNRAYRLDLVADDGTSDVAFTRFGAGVQVSNDFTSVGSLLGARMSVTGTDGTGFLQFIEQSSDAAAPSADRARLFAKDNGAGKTQLCVRFNSGAVVVLATQP